MLGGRFAAYGWSTKNSDSLNATRHGACVGGWSGALTAGVLAARAVDGDLEIGAKFTLSECREGVQQRTILTHLV